MRLDVDVGDDRDLRRGDWGILEPSGESLGGWRHEVGVKRAGHRELHHHPRLELGLGDLGNLIDRGNGPGDGVVAVAQVVCDLHGLAAAVGGGFGAQFIHLIRGEACE